MIEKRMILSDLGILLELSDERSIIKWCNKHRIPVIELGKAKFVLSTFIDLYFETEVKKFVNLNYENPVEILKAIEIDDKILLSKLIEAPVSNKTKKEFEKKESRSKAASDFLKHFKAA